MQSVQINYHKQSYEEDDSREDMLELPTIECSETIFFAKRFRLILRIAEFSWLITSKSEWGSKSIPRHYLVILLSSSQNGLNQSCSITILKVTAITITITL